MSWYDQPPKQEVIFEELEEWAFMRCRVLHCRAIGDQPQPQDQEVLQKITTDIISHHIVRLAASLDIDLWQIWVECELNLFRDRLLADRGDILANLLEPLHPRELCAAKKDNQMTAVSKKDLLNAYLQQDNSVILKTPFENATNLMANRDCVLNQGEAWTEISCLPSILQCMLRRRLSDLHSKTRQLALQAKLDTMLESLLMRLCLDLRRILSAPKNWLTASASATNAQLDLEDIDNLWQTHMPLCATVIHRQLLTKHHLKHFDRIQHMLFLKGAGLNHERTERLFSFHFLQTMSTEDYRKKRYDYSIRHIHGLEGSRINRPPFDCTHLIEQDTAIGNCNGCPYRTLDAQQLDQQLTNRRLDSIQIQSIKEKAEQQDFVGACHAELCAMLRAEGVAEEHITQINFEAPYEYFNIRRILTKVL